MASFPPLNQLPVRLKRRSRVLDLILCRKSHSATEPGSISAVEGSAGPPDVSPGTNFPFRRSGDARGSPIATLSPVIKRLIQNAGAAFASFLLSPPFSLFHFTFIFTAPSIAAFNLSLFPSLSPSPSFSLAVASFFFNLTFYTGLIDYSEESGKRSDRTGLESVTLSLSLFFLLRGGI